MKIVFSEVSLSLFFLFTFALFRISHISPPLSISSLSALFSSSQAAELRSRLREAELARPAAASSGCDGEN